jgi:hypothetical protein
MSGCGGRGVAGTLVAAAMCGVFAAGALAQDMPPIVAPPPAPIVSPDTPAVIPIKPVASAPSAPQFSAVQLDQFVAPVALYPDPLLGQVLMASTYSQQVADAARWVRVPANRTLGGEALTAAFKAKGWNPSVMALVPFPGLLAMMTDKLDWTEQLGAAYLAQPGDMMAAVQRLRHAALAAGSLKAAPECHCVIQTSGDQISILPTDNELVSVPVYNPANAYGTWANVSYPPAAFPLPPGFVFASGATVGYNPAIEVALFGPIWGWDTIDWPNRHIVVDEARYKVLAPNHVGFAGGVWVHEAPLPPPRHLVAHNAPAVATHPGHHARTLAMRRLAMMRPPYPPYWWAQRHHVSVLPPGTIVPPPPPRHMANAWVPPPWDYRRY